MIHIYYTRTSNEAAASSSMYHTDEESYRVIYATTLGTAQQRGSFPCSPQKSQVVHDDNDVVWDTSHRASGLLLLVLGAKFTIYRLW